MVAFSFLPHFSFLPTSSDSLPHRDPAMRVLAEHTAVVIIGALICVGAWMSGMDWKNFGFAVCTGYLQVLVRTWRLNCILHRIIDAEDSLSKNKEKWARKTNKKKRCSKTGKR